MMDPERNNPAYDFRKFRKMYGRGVTLRHAGVAVPKQKWFSRRIQPSYEIYFFCAGRGRLLVEDSDYPLCAGDILVFKPLEAHQIRIDPTCPFEKINVEFSPQTFAEFDPDGSIFKPFSARPAGRFNVLHPEDFPDEHWRRCLYRMLYRAQTPALEKMQVFGNLFALCCEVARVLDAQMAAVLSPQPTLPAQVLSYIEANLISIHSIAELAQTLHFSPSGLRALFRRTVGVSPQRYLMEQKLALARTLLCAGAPAQRACVLSGFVDYTSFFRAYKRRYGVSPKEHPTALPAEIDFLEENRLRQENL